MTKTDYEIIASVLREATITRAVREYLAFRFAAALKDTNPRFDSDRFVDACITLKPFTID